MFDNIKNSHGEQLDYSFHKVEGDRKNIVILGHGVTGDKDRPLIAALAQNLTDCGIPALRFSFSGNGNSGGRFTESTISKEVADLGAVLDALNDCVICYVGHSMGSTVGLLRASQDDRIKILVSLAGIVHTQIFAETEFGDVTPGAGLMWNEPDCPLSRAYMDDMSRIKTVLNKTSKISIPWLFVHGTEDDVVPIKDSREIFNKANNPKELIEIQNADHVFSEKSTNVMVTQVVSWINTQFNRLN